jgi:hypothetical protein
MKAGYVGEIQGMNARDKKVWIYVRKGVDACDERA